MIETISPPPPTTSSFFLFGRLFCILVYMQRKFIRPDECKMGIAISDFSIKSRQKQENDPYGVLTTKPRQSGLLSSS